MSWVVALARSRSVACALGSGTIPRVASHTEASSTSRSSSVTYASNMASRVPSGNRPSTAFQLTLSRSSSSRIWFSSHTCGVRLWSWTRSPNDSRRPASGAPAPSVLEKTTGIEARLSSLRRARSRRTRMPPCAECARSSSAWRCTPRARSSKVSSGRPPTASRLGARKSPMTESSCGCSPSRWNWVTVRVNSCRRDQVRTTSAYAASSTPDAVRPCRSALARKAAQRCGASTARCRTKRGVPSCSGATASGSSGAGGSASSRLVQYSSASSPRVSPRSSSCAST